MIHQSKILTPLIAALALMLAAPSFVLAKIRCRRRDFLNPRRLGQTSGGRAHRLDDPRWPRRRCTCINRRRLTLPLSVGPKFL